MNFYDEIIGSNTWSVVDLVNKGWSSDKKYHIQTSDGRELLLRVSDISHYDVKKEEFNNMKALCKRDILMSYPLDFGVCNQGKSVYILLSWIKGEDAETAVPRMNDKDQYLYGVKAGETLQEIHKLPVLEAQEDWFEKFNRKIDRNFRYYEECGIKFNFSHELIAYINDNRELLRNRPQTFQHGDYHTGNMLINEDRELGIIDFNRFDYGDPWEEFNRIVWCVRTSKSFASGYINGYFNNQVPDLFFRLMALYIATNQLASLPWAKQFNQKEVDDMLELCESVTEWYDGFKRYVPEWYYKIDN